MEHQINQSDRKSSQKKVCLVPGVKRIQNFVWELPDGIYPGNFKVNRTQVELKKP
jgi:hypothetical protein